jgi:hypothetical protein
MILSVADFFYYFNTFTELLFLLFYVHSVHTNYLCYWLMHLHWGWKMSHKRVDWCVGVCVMWNKSHSPADNCALWWRFIWLKCKMWPRNARQETSHLTKSLLEPVKYIYYVDLEGSVLRFEELDFWNII